MSRHAVSVLIVLLFNLEIKARVILCYNFMFCLLISWVLVGWWLGSINFCSTLLRLFVFLRFWLRFDWIPRQIEIILTYVRDGWLIKQEETIIVAAAAWLILCSLLWWTDDNRLWLLSVCLSIEVWIGHTCHSFTHRVATLCESGSFWWIVNTELLVLLFEVLFFGSDKLLWVKSLGIVKAKLFVKVNFIVREGNFKDCDKGRNALSWDYVKSP